MKHTLYGKLQEYISQGIYSFHMPGHKYNPEFLPPDLLSLDMTEIDGMDNLHAPEGAIKRLQEKIASVYGADESFFLVNGSSSGIVAAICAVCGEGMPLYVQRNCHQSVFNAMVLSGANPLYFNDIIPEVNGAAVVITCPSYGGDVIDILPIADKVHAGGGILIVDEAHGAHFPFHGQFPPTALSQGADIAVNSFHKTLPALTQTAALHVRGTRANRKRLRFYLRAMQTTSPSYIFMASVDFMLDKLEREPYLFERYIENLGNLINGLPKVGEKKAVTLSVKKNPSDISKLNLNINTNLSGNTVSKILKIKYKLEMEMADEKSMLAITGVADTTEGLNRLFRAVKEINRDLSFREASRDGDECLKIPTEAETVFTPAQALRLETETVPLREAAGRIAGEFFTVYPPGIPLLVPGEKIKNEIIGNINKNQIKVLR